MYLIYPLLVLVLVRMGLGYASLSMLCVGAIGGWLTVRGSGPLPQAGIANPEFPSLLLQAFVAFGMMMLYTVSVWLERQKATERRLQEIVSLHALVTENSRDVIILADLEGNRRYVSAAAEGMGGWKPQELIKNGSYAFVHPEDVPRAKEAVRKLQVGAGAGMIECRARNKSGDYVWVEASLRLIRDPQTGAPTGILNIVRDISERKRAEQSREFHHSLIRAIHEVSLAGILVVNDEASVVSINKRFSDIWRLSTPDTPVSLHEQIVVQDQLLLSQCIDQVKDPEAFIRRVQELYADPDANDKCEIEMKDGRTLERYSTGLRSEGGQYLGRVWFFDDITERKLAARELQAAYNKVEALSTIDSLTGLANRRRFDEHLEVEWRRSIREHTPLSMLLVDVDHFKSFNDSYGHVRGDSCLRQIAESALGSVTRPGDLVARFGGDEFTIILADTDNGGAVTTGNRVCEAVRSRKLVHSANERGIVTVSIGCASLIPKVGQTAETLIEFADRALYCAKRSGRNRVFNSNAVRDDGDEVKISAVFLTSMGRPV
jgi:diguanylate cyclase (GGDEF)-like protein/PAS domain S-box-containing protein